MKLHAAKRLKASTVVEASAYLDEKRATEWLLALVQVPKDSWKHFVDSAISARLWFQEFAKWTDDLTRAPVTARPNTADIRTGGIYLLSMIRKLNPKARTPAKVFRTALLKAPVPDVGDTFVYKHVRQVASWSMTSKLGSVEKARSSNRQSKNFTNVLLEAKPQADMVVWTPDCVWTLDNLVQLAFKLSRNAERGSEEAKRLDEVGRRLNGIDPVDDEQEVVLYTPKGIKATVLRRG